jgi:DNA-binding NtrC family response regulator
MSMDPDAHRQPRVLVVDDDESMGEFLVAQLALRGFCSSFETDPRRVLRCIASLDVDVLVTDLRMSEMDGLELRKG